MLNILRALIPRSRTLEPRNLLHRQLNASQCKYSIKLIYKSFEGILIGPQVIDWT